jgi:hypothetical protein
MKDKLRNSTPHFHSGILGGSSPFICPCNAICLPSFPILAMQHHIRSRFFNPRGSLKQLLSNSTGRYIYSWQYLRVFRRVSRSAAVNSPALSRISERVISICHSSCRQFVVCCGNMSLSLSSQNQSECILIVLVRQNGAASLRKTPALRHVFLMEATLRKGSEERTAWSNSGGRSRRVLLG